MARAKKCDAVERFVKMADALKAVMVAVKAGKAWKSGKFAGSQQAGENVHSAYAALGPAGIKKVPIWLQTQNNIEVPMKTLLSERDFANAASFLNRDQLKANGFKEPYTYSFFK